jgi:hypothetical protein
MNVVPNDRCVDDLRHPVIHRLLPRPARLVGNGNCLNKECSGPACRFALRRNDEIRNARLAWHCLVIDDNVVVRFFDREPEALVYEKRRLRAEQLVQRALEAAVYQDQVTPLTEGCA